MYFSVHEFTCLHISDPVCTFLYLSSVAFTCLYIHVCTRLFLPLPVLSISTCTCLYMPVPVINTNVWVVCPKKHTIYSTVTCSTLITEYCSFMRCLIFNGLNFLDIFLSLFLYFKRSSNILSCVFL